MSQPTDFGFPTAEAYFIDRDLFVRYVLEKVNPARKDCGLDECTEGIARALFDTANSRRYRQPLSNP